MYICPNHAYANKSRRKYARDVRELPNPKGVYLVNLGQFGNELPYTVYKFEVFGVRKCPQKLKKNIGCG